jgi:hypothetical protein
VPVPEPEPVPVPTRPLPELVKEPVPVEREDPLFYLERPEKRL